MPTLIFPSNPTLDQQYTAPNGNVYTFDGVKWVGAVIGSTINSIGYGSSTIYINTSGDLVIPTGANIVQQNGQPAAFLLAEELTNDGFTFPLNRDGTLVLPNNNQNVSFNAPLGSLGWSYTVDFNYSANGVVTATIPGYAGAWPSNPGYNIGDTFSFDSTYHGIPDYVFTITISNITNLGEIGFGPTLSVSAPPPYQPDFVSTASILIATSSSHYILGNDGNMYLPGHIVFPDRTVQATAYNGSASSLSAIGINYDVWVETYADVTVSDQNAGESVLQAPDGSVYITGTDTSSESTGTAWIKKLSATGQPLWTLGFAPPPGTLETSGESIALDSQGNVYLLVNAWADGPAVWGVIKISPSGSIIWSSYQSDSGDYGWDICVNSFGQIFIAADEGLYSLNSNGSVNWIQTGFRTMTVIDNGSNLLVGGDIVLGVSYSGTVLWTNNIFDNTGVSIWGLAYDGTDWYAAENEGTVVKVSGIDNTTILWQTKLHIGSGNTGYYITWLDYNAADGCVYVDGANSDSAGANGFITTQLNGTTGAIGWANILHATFAEQWEWYGHHDLSVLGEYYVITGYSYLNGSNTGTMVTAKFPTTGNYTGSTFGPFDYQSTLVTQVSPGLTSNYSGSPVSPFTTGSTTLVTSTSVLVSLPNDVDTLYNSTATMSLVFNGEGVEFPDGSVQTTAFDGRLTISTVTNYPAGQLGDTVGDVIFNDVNNIVYLATATFVTQNTQTVIVYSSEDYNISQSSDRYISATFTASIYPSLVSDLRSLTTNTSVFLTSPAFIGSRQVYDWNMDSDHITFSVLAYYQEGDSSDYPAGTEFAVNFTFPQPAIWRTLSPSNQIINGSGATLGFDPQFGLSVSKGTTLSFLTDPTGGYNNRYGLGLGSGYYEYSQFTASFVVSQTLPLVMGGAGIQLVDYTSNLYANTNEAAAIFIGNTTPTGNVDGIDDTDSDVGTVRIQSFNTLTQVTNTWTYTANGSIASNEITLVSVNTGSVTVSHGAAYTWVNFIASQFHNSGSPVVVQDVQNDTMGNVFATIVDANTATTTSTNLSYIVKYDYQGNPLWAVEFEGLVSPASFGLAIDSAGDAYLNLVETAESQYHVSYITKVSGLNGAIIWSTEVSDIGDLAYNAVIDHNNNLVVNGVYIDNATYLQMWVAKLNSSNGNIIWQIAMPKTATNNQDSGLSIDNNNNILVSGTSYNGTDTGFVIQLDTNGNVLSAFTIATTGSYDLQVSDTVTDSLGNFYLSGGFYYTNTNSNVVEAGFLAQINLTSTATVGWAYQIGTGNGCVDMTTTIDVDQNDNLYILGVTGDLSNGSMAASLGSFSSTGTERWQYYIESPGSDENLTLPGGLIYDEFSDGLFTSFGSNMSYNGNGMLDLGVQLIYGEGNNWYPFILQVPANGTPFDYTHQGDNMAPIWSTASNWVPQPIELSLTPFTPTVNTSTLTVVYNPGQLSTGTVSIGYYGATEYDYTTSTVYNQPVEWQFNQDGSLQLPFQGVIRDSGMGQSLVSQNYAQLEWAQDGVLNSNNTSSYVWVDFNGVHLQTYRNLSDQHNWEFDFNGNLTFPAGNTELIWPHMNISYTDADASSALTITDGQGGTYTFEKEQFILSTNTNIVFGDETVQTTAFTPSLITEALNTSTAVAGEWTSPNNNQWFVTTWNSGFSGTYDGTNPLVWFDPSLATIPGGLSASNVRGGVVEYHAFDGQDTIVGTIWFSGDYNTFPSSATHIEHTTGGNNAELKSYWNITQNYPTKLAFTNAGGSIPIMVQWTARLFWGSENAC
jgi:hypothetical protein